MPRQKKQKLKQRADNRFRRVYHGKLFYGKTQEEADAKRDAFIRQEAAEEYNKSHVKVGEYTPKWLSLHKADVSIKCYNDYAKQLEALVEAIGDKELNDITVDDAGTVWKHYAGYSASTIKRAKMLYVALFDAAVENDLCRKNPFRGRFAQPPKAPAGTHRALTDEEINIIWQTPHRMQLAALIMLYCGLRRGEVLALTSDDIDIKKCLVTVNKAIRFDGNKPVMTTPKTSAGIRVIPIPNIIVPFFEDYSGKILSTTKGGYMTETAFSRCWDSFILHLSNTAKHPVNIRPHDLRHTYCTLLADAGVSMKQAMAWMGHADEKMILHVYDHVSEKRTQTSINQVESLLLKGQIEGQFQR